MILIADSGSTKTSWFYSDCSDNKETISTNGINPFFRNSEDIFRELEDALLPQTGGDVEKIFFYGAGIINVEKVNVVKTALQKLYPLANIEVESDLLAAARSTLGNEKGIACILGTGSNSCLYDGEKIVKHVPPLGFVLGDEGSGAVLGRKLVGDFLKGIMPDKLAKKFNKQYNCSYSDILERVYKKEKPNKYLAGFVPFLRENIAESYCNNLVERSFNEFLIRNVKQYTEHSVLGINFIGSVAFYFQEQLELAIKSNDLRLGKILKEPLDGLVQYHLNR